MVSPGRLNSQQRYVPAPIRLSSCILSLTAQVIDEARDVTTVDISAVKWDSKTSAQGGCGEDGCRPELAYVRAAYCA